jgi:hypothetical protein
VKIAVADPGSQHLQQHLGAGGFRRRLLVVLVRRAALADLEASMAVPVRRLLNIVMARPSGPSTT